MRYIVDIPPDVVDLVQKYINKNEYRSIQDFIINAIQNQIYLIENSDQINTCKVEPPSIKTDQSIKLKDRVNLLELRDVTIITFQPDPSKLSSSLSGFWNKFFPVKVVIRVLTNLINENKGAILLDSLQETASVEARNLGLSLFKMEKGSGKKRGDRLFTGLPVKKNSESSRSRFKSHFVGSLTVKKIDGMSGILRLIDIEKRDDGKDYVSLTPLGLEFYKLQNPILDLKNYDHSLSIQEKAFLLKIIQTHLQEEYEDIKFVLNLIAQGKKDTKELHESVLNYKQGFNINQISTFLSGLLNRLSDLDLVIRRYNGLSYLYEISEKGKELIVSGV